MFIFYLNVNKLIILHWNINSNIRLKRDNIFIASTFSYGIPQMLLGYSATNHPEPTYYVCLMAAVIILTTKSVEPSQWISGHQTTPPPPLPIISHSFTGPPQVSQSTAVD